MLNLTTADKALKDYYLDAVTEQLNTGVNPVFAMIEKTSENVYGKTIKKIVTAGLNAGISAGTEDGELPTAHPTEYKEFTLELKNLYGSIEISDKAIRASQDNSGAVVNLLNAEMEALVKSSKMNLSRMLFGDGTGIVTKLSSVDKENHSFSPFNPQLFDPNYYYDIVSGDGDILVENFKAVSMQGSKVYVDASVDLSLITNPSLSYLVVHGSYNNEISGIKAVFAKTPTLYGLSRAENIWLKPYELEMSGPLTIDDLQTAIDNIEIASGEQVDVMVCSRKTRRILAELFKENAVKTDNVTLDGGYKAISYNGIPIVVDENCGLDLFLLNTSHIKMYQLCDWEWLQAEDGKILHQIAGKAAYGATLVKYCEVLCDKPNSLGIIRNIG